MSFQSLNRSLAVLLAVFLLNFAVSVNAQDSPRAFEFPQDARQWINSQPWSLAQISGKSAFLFFFEEGCPKCRARWPELNQLAESHAEDPVLFIAVSSGTDRDQMENYIQQNQVGWKVLLDPDRSFEQACQIQEISLQNITQAAIIGGNGQLRPASWANLEQSVSNALTDAKWNVDPQLIPQSLRTTWQQVEFHNYAAAGPAIKKSLKSSKEETKAAAEALLAAVQPVIDEKVAAAAAAYDASEKWTAFRSYSEIVEQFKGYELPDEVNDRRKELQTDPKIKVEAAAMKTLHSALKLVDNPSQRKKGAALLKKLVKDKPDTEAGRKAQARLDELD